RLGLRGLPAIRRDVLLAGHRLLGRAALRPNMALRHGPTAARPGAEARHVAVPHAAARALPDPADPAVDVLRHHAGAEHGLGYAGCRGRPEAPPPTAPQARPVPARSVGPTKKGPHSMFGVGASSCVDQSRTAPTPSYFGAWLLPSTRRVSQAGT